MRILVIQLRYVGDVLVTTPVLRALRQRYPEARVDFLVQGAFRPLLEGNPNVDRILEHDARGTLAALRLIAQVRRARYDLVVDYQGSSRTGFVTLCSGAALRLGPSNRARRLFYSGGSRRHSGWRYVARAKLEMLEPAGIAPASGDWSEAELLPDLWVPPSARDAVETFLADSGVDPSRTVVAIDPTSRRETRRWRSDGFAELADRLSNSWGATVVFLWGPGERDEVRSIEESCRQRHLLAPPTDLLQLAALIERSDLLIGNDSGPRHIAVACGTPSLTILGSSVEERWTFPSERHRAVFEPVHCRPCLLKVCPTQLECMNQLTAEKVARAAEEMRTTFARAEDGR